MWNDEISAYIIPDDDHSNPSFWRILDVIMRCRQHVDKEILTDEALNVIGVAFLE